MLAKNEVTDNVEHILRKICSTLERKDVKNEKDNFVRYGNFHDFNHKL